MIGRSHPASAPVPWSCRVNDEFEHSCCPPKLPPGCSQVPGGGAKEQIAAGRAALADEVPMDARELDRRARGQPGDDLVNVRRAQIVAARGRQGHRPAGARHGAGRRTRSEPLRAEVVGAGVAVVARRRGPPGWQPATLPVTSDVVDPLTVGAAPRALLSDATRHLRITG